MLLRKSIKYFSSKSFVNITFKNKDGSLTPIKAPIGQHLLQIAHDNEIELEGLFHFYNYSLQSKY